MTLRCARGNSKKEACRFSDAPAEWQIPSTLDFKPVDGNIGKFDFALF